MIGADNSPGGVLGYINSLVAYSEHARFEFHITVSSAGTGGDIYFHPSMTPHIFPRTYGIGSFLIQMIRLRKILVHNGIQVFHMHTLRAGFLGAIASIGLPVTKIYTGHSWRYLQKSGALKRRVFYVFEKLTCSFADKITFLTEKDRQLGIAENLVAKENAVLIRTRIEPCDSTRYSEGRLQSVRKEFSLPTDAFVIGTTALMTARKDPLTFVRVAARVAQVVPAAHFLWVGDGNMKTETMELAKKLGIMNRLTVTGMLAPDQVEEVLLLMNVFLFTSLIEGVPLSILAAQSCGLPIVCSRYEGSGVEEVIQDGQTGLTFLPGDDATAAAHILSIIQDPAKTKSMINRMKKDFAEQHADPSAMAREFESIYRIGNCQN